MKHFIISTIILASTMASAADPQFTNLTSDDFDSIANEASANFTHNSMMGASKLGTVFGFQVGFTAAQTASPKSDAIAKRNSGSELPKLYNAGVMAAVGIPFGLSVEAVLLPKMSATGGDMSSTSFGLKWNINDVVPILPVNVALRGVYTDAKLSFNQVVSGATATVENKTKVNGLQILVSPMIPVVEPYAGVGFLTGTNELSVSGTSAGTIFDPSYSSSQSEKKTVTGTQMILGVEASLVVVKFGAEYSKAFGTDRYGIKFAMGF